MKRTSKILFGIIAGLVVVVMALAVGARMYVGSVIGSGKDREARMELSGTRAERSFEESEFDRIEISGAWQMEVRRGDNYRVHVAADEALLDKVSVERRGTTLNIEAEKWGWHEDARLRAELVMPNLSGLSASGGVDVEIADFVESDLKLDIAGAAHVEGHDNRIDRLVIIAEGASDIDFTSSKVVNADVRMDGAGNVDLTMDGGELVGRIGGVGSVTYAGEVSNESVRFDGLGSVERR